MDGRRTDEVKDRTAERSVQREDAAELHESFAITSNASLLDGRRLVLEHGDSFGVFDNYGDATSVRGSVEGLYHRDTRGAPPRENDPFAKIRWVALVRPKRG